MGTIKQGILGGFSGRVGTVVGSNWKSVHYMRALAVNISNPNTEKQQLQRNKFSMALRFLKTFTPFIRTGYHGYAQKQSEFNAAMAYVMRYAMNDDATIDHNKALVARGNLATAIDATADVKDGKVSYTWKDNSGTGDAETTDRAMLLAYNKDRQEAVYEMDTATRTDAKAELALPANWTGNAMAIYLSFCSEDGKSVANSVCLKNDDSNNENPDHGSGSGSDGDENENPLG